MPDAAPSFDAPTYVDRILTRAAHAAASDVHVEPVAGGVEIRFRIDGMLETIEKLPTDAGRAVALRLMVMAQLLTYRLEIPQEGRIRWEFAADKTTDNVAEGNAPNNTNNTPKHQLDLRLAMMPVAHGIRAAVRLPAELSQPRTLAALQLPPQALQLLHGFARSDGSGTGGGGGMLLVTGPAGSGKTTTIYALLEYIASTNPGISIISLEDPIERLVPGITQIEVTPQGQMTYERALKSILRQDPQVLMLGEIRDAATAGIAIQAALSGHRLIATMHAGEPATAIARLLEMGVEPYQISSSLYGILTQRLLRRQGEPGGYKGRTPVAEAALLTDALRQQILLRPDAAALRTAISQQPNHQTLRQSAETLAARHITDQQEIARVLGTLGTPPGAPGS